MFSISDEISNKFDQGFEIQEEEEVKKVNAKQHE